MTLSLLPTESDPVRVVEGDCLRVLADLPDGCIDAVVTDPPYPGIDRPYGRWTEAEWFALINPVVEQCRRVLRPTGSAVFVLQPNAEKVGRMRTWLWEFMLKWGREWGIVQDAWWWNYATLPNGGATERGLMRASLKACVWLGSDACYRDQLAVLWTESQRNAAARLTARAGREYFPSGNGVDNYRACSAAVTRGGVTPFNVLPMANTNSTDSAGSHGHGAGTPLALCRWWVRYICPPGGVVLDPFAGSGTAGLAALDEGRRAVLIERVPEYAEIARARVAAATCRGPGSLFAEVE